MPSFRTIANIGEAIYKDKGSKFMGYAIPVINETELSGILSDYKKKYFDATHHCYAYRVGVKNIQYRANDDGEPNHSAGDPILGKIKSLDLTNTLVLVIRYYGGTKLGVSGLINAYRTAAEQALEACKIIEVEITVPIRIEYHYENTNDVMRQIDQLGISIVDHRFEETCLLNGIIAEDKYPELVENLKLQTKVHVSHANSL